MSADIIKFKSQDDIVALELADNLADLEDQILEIARQNLKHFPHLYAQKDMDSEILEMMWAAVLLNVCNLHFIEEAQERAGSKKELMYCRKMYSVPMEIMPFNTCKLPFPMTITREITDNR